MKNSIRLTGITLLIDYKLLRELGQRRRTQTTTFKSMEDYLKRNEARLMNGDSRN